jgi:hypothetical protein
MSVNSDFHSGEPGKASICCGQDADSEGKKGAEQSEGKKTC